MNTDTLLRNAGFQWTLCSSRLSPYSHEIEITHPDLSESFVRRFNLNNFTQVETELVDLILKSNFDETLKSQVRLLHGFEPVSRIADVQLSYAVHSAMRKLSQSGWANIAWHALTQIDAETGDVFWKAIQSGLDSVFNEWGTPNRDVVARWVQESVVNALNSAKITSSHPNFNAYLNLRVACEEAPLQEWKAAWLGYVLKSEPFTSTPPTA